MNLSEIKQHLKKNNIYLSKQRSQNFLIDTNITKYLIRQVDIKKEDQILEIGTGLGALTEHLAELSNYIISYEKDKKIYQIASQLFKSYSNVEIIHQDFLKSDFLNKFKEPFRVIANVPYNITSQILIKLWLQKNMIKDVYLLVQKEVGLRLTSKKLDKNTSFLSILLQLDFDIKTIKTVKPQSFFPAPKVDSVYLQFMPVNNSLTPEIRPFLFEFVKNGFAQKRKKLITKLKSKYKNIDHHFQKYNISTDIRAEQLSPEKWLKLFYSVISFKEN